MNKLQSTCNIGWQMLLIASLIVVVFLLITEVWVSYEELHIPLITITSIAVIHTVLSIDCYEANDDGILRKSILGKNAIQWSQVQDAYYIYHNCTKSTCVECVVLVKEKKPKRYGYYRTMLLVLCKKAVLFSVSSKAYRGTVAVPYFDKSELVTLAEKHGVRIVETRPRVLTDS